MSDAFRDAVPSWDEAMRTRLSARQIVRTNGCIEYTGQSWGTYGQLEYRRVTYLAHRAAWVLKYGDIENGLWVLHRCDNPKCINVDHLFLGTPKMNTQDMIAKGRARYNPTRKLSAEQLVKIRLSLINKEPQRSIAIKNGVSQGLISMIARGKRHLEVVSNPD